MKLAILSTASLEDMTFWEKITALIEELYLGVDSGHYENIKMGSMFSLRHFLLGAFIGCVIACVAASFNKQVLGGFVRAMLACGCTSPEKAATLEEMGFHKKVAIRSAVKSSVNLRRVVKCVEEEEFYLEQARDKSQYDQKRADNPKLPKYKEKNYLIDVSTAHFYIPEELKYTADTKFEKKGSSWITLIISIAVLSVLFLAVLMLAPLMLELIDNALGNFKS